MLIFFCISQEKLTKVNADYKTKIKILQDDLATSEQVQKDFVRLSQNLQVSKTNCTFVQNNFSLFKVFHCGCSMKFNIHAYIYLLINNIIFNKHF